MSALLFPGQGSQVVGMGSEFYNNFEIVKKIFKEADNKLNYSISRIILEGPESELQLTKNTQPAILVVSYSIFKVLKEEFNFSFDNFKYFAGHSLGEYSALVSAEALNFSDAVYLLNERGKSMQNAVPLGEGSMLAVLGLSIKEIEELIKLSDLQGGICEIANDNAIGQVIVSGTKKTLDTFQKSLKEKKIKSITLKVSAPFHCSLMKPAADEMREKINKTKMGKPKKDIVTNVNALPEIDINNIKRLLVDQIFSTVKWRESLLTMYNNGIKNFIEIGPGKVLSGMVKRTLKDVNSFSINSITDIKNLRDEFKK